MVSGPNRNAVRTIRGTRTAGGLTVIVRTDCVWRVRWIAAEQTNRLTVGRQLPLLAGVDLFVVLRDCGWGESNEYEREVTDAIRGTLDYRMLHDLSTKTVRVTAKGCCLLTTYYVACIACT